MTSQLASFDESNSLRRKEDKNQSSIIDKVVTAEIETTTNDRYKKTTTNDFDEVADDS